MPILHLRLNVALEGDERRELLSSIAQAVSDVLEKPPEDVMVSLVLADFWMEGNDDPAAFIDFRCLPGLQDEDMACLSEEIVCALRRFVPIAPQRVFLHFLEACPEGAWRFREGTAVCSKGTLEGR